MPVELDNKLLLATTDHEVNIIVRSECLVANISHRKSSYVIMKFRDSSVVTCINYHDAYVTI